MVDISRIKTSSGVMPQGKISAKSKVSKEDKDISLQGDSVSINGKSAPAAKKHPSKHAVKSESAAESAPQVEKKPSSPAKSSPVIIPVIEESKAGEAGSVKESEKVDDSIFVPGPESALVNTKSTVENMTKLAQSVRLSENVLLVGPTGAGKTGTVSYLAHLTQNPLRRLNFHDTTDITEIIGGYKPDETKKGRPDWQDGVVVQAMKRGQWLLLDEVNLADSAITESLNSLLDDDRSLTLTDHNNEVIKAHPDFRVFCTMNPSSYAGRKKLSNAAMNRLKKIWMDGMPADEMVEVIKLRSKADLSDKTLLQMSMFHQTIADLAEHRQLGKREGQHVFTIRDVLKWVKRINHFSKKEPNTPIEQILWREAGHIYCDRFANDADRAIIQDTLKLTFGESGKPGEVKKDISSNGKTVKIGASEIDVNPAGGQFVPGEKANLVNIKSTVEMMEKITKCASLDEPVLLVGPTAAGKTAKVKYLSRLANNNLRRFNLSLQTSTSEFIGGYKPTGVPGEYKWVDGILVDAMKKGDWLVLDEINLAESSILESINSVLDGDRSIVLGDKGGEKVKAHPNFRIFATMNPATSEYAGRKELSLAFRNRFSEIYDPGITDKGELAEIVKADMKNVQDGPELAEKMVDLQSQVQEKVSKKELAAKQREGFIYTIRNLLNWSKFIRTFAPETGRDKSFVDGAEHVYASEFSDRKDRETVTAMAKQALAGN